MFWQIKLYNNLTNKYYLASICFFSLTNLHLIYIYEIYIIFSNKLVFSCASKTIYMHLNIMYLWIICTIFIVVGLSSFLFCFYIFVPISFQLVPNLQILKVLSSQSCGLWWSISDCLYSSLKCTLLDLVSHLNFNN